MLPIGKFCKPPPEIALMASTSKDKMKKMQEGIKSELNEALKPLHNLAQAKESPIIETLAVVTSNATSWTPAMTGPTVDVKDGSVEGWAFTFSSDAMPDASAPKSAPSFEAICGATPAVEGKKRIGLLVDFGPQSLQPEGESTPELVQECVVVDQSALGSDVLGQVTKINAGSSGLICGINGYPAKECGIEVEAPEEFRK